MAVFSPTEGRERIPVEPEDYLLDAPPEFSTDTADICTVARARGLSLDGWELLGRSEQEFLKRIYVFNQLGKGAIGELALLATSRRSGDRSDEAVEKLQKTASEQYRHFRILKVLGSRLEVGADAAIRSQLANVLRSVFDRISPDDTDPVEPPLMPALVAMTAAMVDVLFDTAFDGAEHVLERTDAVPGLTELTRALHDGDRQAHQRRMDLLETFRRRDDQTRDLVDSTLERSVMPVMNSIRSAQRQFDVIQMGLVPDEFIARALDRLFSLNDSPSVGPGSAGS